MSNIRDTKRTIVIGEYRVDFVRGVGWQCTCELWREGNGCQHAQLAAALITLENAVVALGGSITRH